MAHEGEFGAFGPTPRGILRGYSPSLNDYQGVVLVSCEYAKIQDRGTTGSRVYGGVFWRVFPWINTIDLMYGNTIPNIRRCWHHGAYTQTRHSKDLEIPWPAQIFSDQNW